MKPLLSQVPAFVLLVAHVGFSAMATGTGDFYRFAQKSTELYRGQMMTRQETAVFVADLKRACQPTPDTNAYLAALEANPYDLDINAGLMDQLGREINHARRQKDLATMERVQFFKEKLSLHVNMLHVVASTYAE